MKTQDVTRPQLFACRALQVGLAGRALLPPLDLSIESGQFWAVVGRNGTGKTTWLRTLLGLTPPLQGYVARAPSLRVSYLPQRSALDELYPLLAREVVSMGAERGWSFLAGRGAAGRADAAERALVEVDATSLAERPFRSLSEGQKQRVLLARLLAGKAEVAVLDEPTSAMDKVAEREAFELIAKLRAKHGLAIVVVTHYLTLVREFADHVLLLDGESEHAIVGSPAEVFAHPAFRRRYGELQESSHG
jgi:zinc transport system ATP-binding protein